MNSLLRYSVSIVFLVVLLIIIQPVFAKHETEDLFTIRNKKNHYRYYSSPKKSAYIDRLPALYMHVNTENMQPIDPKAIKIGDRMNFKTVEDKNICPILTMPAGSVISGQVARVTTPMKLIRNSRIRIEFDKIIFPNGYELPLNRETFTVRPLVAKRGTRYEMANELFYGAIIGGAKWPIGKYTNHGVSYGIAGGAGLVGGAVYGALVGHIARNAALGALRGAGGKAPYNIIFWTGKSFVMQPGDPILLTINLNNSLDMRLNPKYMNLQQLTMLSSMADDTKIENELISQSETSNNNAVQIIEFYRKSVEQNPSNISDVVNLGRAFISSCRYQEAIKLFENTLAAGNISAELYYYLAQAQSSAGDLSHALENYKLAIDNKFPENKIYLDIANLLQKLGRSEEAAFYFEQYSNSVLVTK